MTPIQYYVLFIILASMVTGILFVLFGQITVRKLRKNPKTKNMLGMELASGWDIINVARALAVSRSWAKKAQESNISFMFANADALRENTTKFDQFLAKCFYWTFVFSGSAGVLLVILDAFGVFGK